MHAVHVHAGTALHSSLGVNLTTTITWLEGAITWLGGAITWLGVAITWLNTSCR